MEELIKLFAQKSGLGDTESKEVVKAFVLFLEEKVEKDGYINFADLTITKKNPSTSNGSTNPTNTVNSVNISASNPVASSDTDGQKS